MPPDEVMAVGAELRARVDEYASRADTYDYDGYVDLWTRWPSSTSMVSLIPAMERAS